jgi:hypothetical protein
MKKVTKSTIAMAVGVTLVLLIAWDGPRNRIELFMERGSIENAVRAYFQAEMQRDYPKLYACLAPSSAYRRAHTYQQFLEDVEKSPVKIQEYRIVDIYRLRDNHDTKTYPGVEKYVQVEVDVDLSFADTGTKSTCNYCFTFLKEKGAWYKG